LAKSKHVRSPRVRKDMPSVALTRAQFDQRFRERFYDPEFAGLASDIDALAEVAWKNYSEYHKSPRTKPAGREFAEPDFELPLEWLATRAAVHEAERRQKDRRSRSRILLINGSARTNQSCPGETSKTWRMTQIAQRAIERHARFEVDLLDLSRLVSEYGRVIHPCKACVSTAQPLCHWPCSCYPNHALGQTQDWMNEIYPRWVAAHGVMIVTPVNWYHTPSVLKLMIDRLVCADGGNPDPTTTRGKDPALAKALELRGWPYPKHLAGRAFAVVVHGDVEGVDGVRRALCDWLRWMDLVPAGSLSEVGRYLGYWEPYATSHDAFDRDKALQGEVRNAALSLVAMVKRIRSGRCPEPDKDLRPSRMK
jgi:multimeric flavodoxin WrbA